MNLDQFLVGLSVGGALLYLLARQLRAKASKACAGGCHCSAAPAAPPAPGAPPPGPVRRDAAL